MNLLIQLLSMEADTRGGQSSHSCDTHAQANVDSFREALEEGVLLDSAEEKVVVENLSALAVTAPEHQTLKTGNSEIQALAASFSESVRKGGHFTNEIARFEENPPEIGEIDPKAWPYDIPKYAGTTTEPVQVKLSLQEDAAKGEAELSTEEWEAPKVTGDQAPQRQDQNIATPVRESHSASEVEAKGNDGGFEVRRAPLVGRPDEQPNATNSVPKAGIGLGFVVPAATHLPTDKAIAFTNLADRPSLMFSAGGQLGSATVEQPNIQVEPSEAVLKAASAPERPIPSGVRAFLPDDVIEWSRNPKHSAQNEQVVDGSKTREVAPPEDVAAIKETRNPAVGLATSANGGPHDATKQSIALPLEVASARLDELGRERVTFRDMIAEVQQGPLGATDRVDAGLRGAFSEGARSEHVNTRSVVNQIVLSATRMAGESSVEVRLYPEELGRVRLTLLPSETGVSVQITAERTETLDLLRRNIDMLESDLRRQGFLGTSFSFGSEHSDRTETSEDDGVEPRDANNAPARKSNLEVELSDIRTDVDHGRLDIRV